MSITPSRPSVNVRRCGSVRHVLRIRRSDGTVHAVACRPVIDLGLAGRLALLLSRLLRESRDALEFTAAPEWAWLARRELEAAGVDPAACEVEVARAGRGVRPVVLTIGVA